MECKQEKNLKGCSCTYTSCVRHGKCCECVAHHRANDDEIPECFFSNDTQKVYKILETGGLKRIK